MQTQVKPKIDIAPMQVVKPNGEAAASILGAGIGLAIYGFTVTLAEAVAAVKTALTLNADVGPLSGKTTVAVVAWLVAWGVLHFFWKDKETDFNKVFVASLILIGIGLLGTFPIFYDLFVPK